MFILRRISETDFDSKFITDNKGFDELNPDGTLKNYLVQDIIKDGEYITYLLIEKKDDGENSELLALFRYKFTSIEEFTQKLIECNTPANDQTIIKKKIKDSKLKIIYLSRIGVVKSYQEMNISQIMREFFELLISRNRENVLIYVKILKNLKKVIGPSYRLIGKNEDKKWGEYYLASRIIKFEPQ